jgi:hypothetical protein
MYQPIALHHQKYLLAKLWEDASVELTQEPTADYSKRKYKSGTALQNSPAWSAPLACTFVSRSALHYSSFFSGSLGSAFSMGLRGSIWSRMAAS